MVSCERATPVLRVADYEIARRFYGHVLGFTVLEEGGEPPRFGIFRRDAAFLFVNAWDGGPAGSAGGWDAYIHVTDLDRLSEELQGRGGVPAKAVHETVYGMREFEIRDPDGNIICFGEDLPDP